MSADSRTYSSQQADNYSLGQAGVAFLSGTSTYTPPTGQVVVAIQFTEDSLFDSSDATTADSEYLLMLRVVLEQIVLQSTRLRCLKVW